MSLVDAAPSGELLALKPANLVLPVKGAAAAPEGGLPPDVWLRGCTHCKRVAQQCGSII